MSLLQNQKQCQFKHVYQVQQTSIRRRQRPHIQTESTSTSDTMSPSQPQCVPNQVCFEVIIYYKIKGDLKLSKQVYHDLQVRLKANNQLKLFVVANTMEKVGAKRN